MRVAHLIITYTSPLQTERMIRQMLHEQFDFYIHLDKKIDISDHLYLASMPNVYLVKKRVDVHWAGLSTVEAVFNAFEEAQNSGVQYDYINLLSGQDYPIKTPPQILDFYTRHKGTEFLKYDAFETDWEEAFKRVRKYHLTDFNFTGKYLLEFLANTFLPRRKPPVPLKFYGRSMFWSLSPECVSYVVKTVRENHALHRFFHYSWGPDEFLFQTILLNSKYAERVSNANCHYYEHQPLVSHPKSLTIADFDALKRSEKLYARKFDMQQDAAILDKIDAMLHETAQDGTQ